MQKDNLVFYEEQDDTFYYIAGYISGVRFTELLGKKWVCDLIRNK